MNKRWPLHPKPHTNQLLSEWVKDLANIYDTDYKNFCQKVLKLTCEEISNFRSFIPEKALTILSDGTGIPIDDLAGRDITTRYKKWAEEYEAMVEVENSQRSCL